jgi:hypothetical protein
MKNRDRLILSLFPTLAGNASAQTNKRWLWIGLFIILGLTPLVTAQTRKLRVVRVPIDMNDGFPKAIQFFCGQQYDHKDCNQHVLALRRVLGHYPVEQLGTWWFVLVPSADWRDLVHDVKHPGSPALTEIERRTTVFEEVLFSARSAPIRSSELLRMFNIPVDALLNLAVSHELGHALCQEKDERQTNTYGRDLRAGEPLVCQPRQSVSKSPATALGAVSK